jgi:hypothetical protein
VVHIVLHQWGKRKHQNRYYYYITYIYYTFMFFMHIILIISFISQVRVDLGIADHVWQEKRAAIAAGINGLGDKFKPELRAAWLEYIRETYPDGPVSEPDIMGDGTLEIDD